MIQLVNQIVRFSNGLGRQSPVKPSPRRLRMIPKKTIKGRFKTPGWVFTKVLKENLTDFPNF